jgi:hypothetical protein
LPGNGVGLEKLGNFVARTISRGAVKGCAKPDAVGFGESYFWVCFRASDAPDSSSGFKEDLLRIPEPSRKVK